MQVVIRVDSSSQIGSGHLMRCLTLAVRLRDGGADVYFICRDIDGNLSRLVSEQGYDLLMLPRAEHDDTLAGYAAWLTVSEERDAADTIEAMIARGLGHVDMLVVDSYAIDSTWEKRLRSMANKIFVIDDLANRHHDCDILLDQNYYKDMKKRYIGLVPQDCEMRLGPRHALLRDEFINARRSMCKRDGNLRRVLVFYGGSDLTCETEKAIKAILSLPDIHIDADIVIGATNAHIDEIKLLCTGHTNLHLHVQAQNMAALMAEADLALGAGGTTTWERCYMGLPTLVTIVADNQLGIAKDCDEAGLICCLGCAGEVSVARMADEIRKCAQPEYLKKLQNACRLDV